MTIEMKNQVSPGVIVVTLAVMAIIFMVGFHVMKKTDAQMTAENYGHISDAAETDNQARFLVRE